MIQGVREWIPMLAVGNRNEEQLIRNFASGKAQVSKIVRPFSYCVKVESGS